ncbi:hypothetical protein Bbelb_221790 [Branchiostoma belcheri]|nr:hypothetical protein Bbelb_221790 [Branchiostoma belcheri]
MFTCVWMEFSTKDRYVYLCVDGVQHQGQHQGQVRLPVCGWCSAPRTGMFACVWMVFSTKDKRVCLCVDGVQHQGQPPAVLTKDTMAAPSTQNRNVGSSEVISCTITIPRTAKCHFTGTSRPEILDLAGRFSAVTGMTNLTGNDQNLQQPAAQPGKHSDLSSRLAVPPDELAMMPPMNSGPATTKSNDPDPFSPSEHHSTNTSHTEINVQASPGPASEPG